MLRFRHISCHPSWLHTVLSFLLSHSSEDATPLKLFLYTASAREAIMVETTGTISCVVCTTDIPSCVENLVTSCGHNWCKSCLQQRFEMACEDEASYPPRCCDEIRLEQAKRFISKETYDLFVEKTAEFSTRHRLYCHRPSCNKFLQQTTTSKASIKCHSCKSRTCGFCQNKAHTWSKCKQSRSDRDFIADAKEGGLQQCPGCKRVVEKSSGCNHMM